jgi:hypothetical protein
MSGTPPPSTDPSMAGGKKARKVSAKTIRKTLKKLGMKPKGRVVLKGGAASALTPGLVGGKKTRRRTGRRGLKGLFGL